MKRLVNFDQVEMRQSLFCHNSIFLFIEHLKKDQKRYSGIYYFTEKRKPASEYGNKFIVTARQKIFENYNGIVECYCEFLTL